MLKAYFFLARTNIENVTCTDTYTISAKAYKLMEGVFLVSLFHCDFLEDLIGSFVRVNRGGPESQKGTIVAVCSDYFVLKN